MTGHKPLAQHRALRALAEGARASLELLADASGRSLKTLRLEAQRDGWQLDRAPPEDVAGRVRAIAALLLDQVEALGRAAMEEGGKIDKTRIDGIVAIIRGLDRIGEIMRPQEAAKENQIKQNEDLADVLDRINHRIVELATDLAVELVEEARGHRRGGSAEKRVAE